MEMEAQSSTTLVSNGFTDHSGKIADKRKTGGWRAAPYIIVAEMAERLAYFAIVVTLADYLHETMHLALPVAATHVTDWVGLSHSLTLLGAFLADASLGRFLTLVIFTFIYAVGMLLLTLQATLKGLQPPPGLPATNKQELILGVSLVLIALGTGGIKPCVATFAADQFDEGDASEAKIKFTFFNWLFFFINMGALIGIGGVASVYTTKGPSWGFGVPAMISVVSGMVVIAGYRLYRFQKPMGSPLTRFTQVIVAACRNHQKGVVVGREVKDGELYEVSTKESDIFGAPKLTRTLQYRFLDKATVVTDSNTSNRWKLCTVTQVEEFKCIVRLMPIMITTTALSISFSQVSTFFVRQCTIMDRRLLNRTMHPGSVVMFVTLNPIIVIPLYVRFVIPFLRKFTGHPRGITSLQRVGVGLFISIFAMAIAALVEKKRLTSTDPKSMSFLWLAPQVFFLGTAEALAFVGQLEFFYDQASTATKSICTAIFMNEIGIAHFLSTAIVKTLQWLTGGIDKGWFQNNLNTSRLDNFYWVLTSINAINFLFYLWASSCYKGRDDEVVTIDTVRDDEDEGSSHGIL